MEVYGMTPSGFQGETWDLKQVRDAHGGGYKCLRVDAYGLTASVNRNMDAANTMPANVILWVIYGATILANYLARKHLPSR